MEKNKPTTRRERNQARAAGKTINEDYTISDTCCEGGEMGASCYHDHCTGPNTTCPKPADNGEPNE